VDGFQIDFVYNGAEYIRVYVNIQKWEVTCFFFFHGELYFVVNPIEVVLEIHQFFLSMLPDDECVVHISVAARRLVCGFFNSFLLEVFHVEVVDNRGVWGSHGNFICLFLKLRVSVGIGGC